MSELQLQRIKALHKEFGAGDLKHFLQELMESLGLPENVCKAVQESLSIASPTAIQNAAIPVLLKEAFGKPGGDVLIQAQTGSGKTLAYALPLLTALLELGSGGRAETASMRESLGTVALIIVPTRELAAQTLNTLNRITSRLRPHWIISTALTGGDSRKSEKARLRKGCHIVVGTPGRLLDHFKSSEGWKRQTLRWVVVDEADRLADLGFEVTVRDILNIVNSGKGPAGLLRLVLLSATVPEKLRREFAGRQLFKPRFIKSSPQKQIYADPSELNGTETTATATGAITTANADGTAVDNAIPSNATPSNATPSFQAPECIEQLYLHVPTKLRLFVLVGLLRDFFSLVSSAPTGRVIVFFSCCDSVDFHHRLFTAKEVSASGARPVSDLPPLLPPRVRILKLHGNLAQSERIRTFNDFIAAGKTGTDPMVLFCTDIAARGLDFPNLSGSIQYDAPCDIHDYIHRAGRTGRLNPLATASVTAKSVLFLMPSEEAYVERLASLGMDKLRKGAFDEYLKWIERFDARKLQDALKRLKVSQKKSAAKKEEGEQSPFQAADEQNIAKLPSTIRSRLALFQDVLEASIHNSRDDLFSLAVNAFVATVRAYATHPSAERNIFHVKRLHLGHLAAAFGLAKEPKAVAATSKHSSSSVEASWAQRDKKRTSNTRDEHRRPAGKNPKIAVSDGEEGPLPY